MSQENVEIVQRASDSRRSNGVECAAQGGGTPHGGLAEGLRRDNAT